MKPKQDQKSLFYVWQPLVTIHVEKEKETNSKTWRQT